MVVMAKSPSVSLAPMSLRRYATTHSQYSLHQWPKGVTPSPHEIFSFPENPVSRAAYDKALKAMYQKYVKIYHPDAALQRDIIDDHTGKMLSPEQKRARFSAVQSAYELLKDPRNRIAFKRYENTSWADYKRGKTTNFEAFRMANAHRKKYAYENDPQFWQAGTWEDYYQMRYNRPAPTQEEWDRNKWSILYGVLAVLAIVAALQVMLALEKTDEFNRQTRLMNLRAKADLSSAYENHLEGISSFQRVRRFLLFRRSSLKARDEEEDKAQKLEENEILTRYARDQLQKHWGDEVGAGTAEPAHHDIIQASGTPSGLHLPVHDKE